MVIHPNSTSTDTQQIWTPIKFWLYDKLKVEPLPFELQQSQTKSSWPVWCIFFRGEVPPGTGVQRVFWPSNSWRRSLQIWTSPPHGFSGINDQPTTTTPWFALLFPHMGRATEFSPWFPLTVRLRTQGDQAFPGAIGFTLRGQHLGRSLKICHSWYSCHSWYE